MMIAVFFYFLFQGLLTTSAKRSRLQFVKTKSTTVLPTFLLQHRFVTHMNELLQTYRTAMNVSSFLYLSVMTGMVGVMVGSIVFASVKAIFMTGSMGLLLPYLLLRMRLLNKQMQIRMDFLPAVEVFYQCYTLNAGQNIRRVLQKTVEEERIREPIRSVFEQLQRDLSTSPDIDHALKIFNLALGHRWSQLFTHIFRVGLTEGVDVSQNLKELIRDMREAIRTNQQERNRLLEIRLANFSPIVFLVLFITINYKLNPTQTYEYYVLNPDGRNMLLDAVFLIFLSFLMGIYLSIKRI